MTTRKGVKRIAVRIKKIVDRETPAQIRKREGIMAKLNQELHRASQVGGVGSVVLYDRKKKAICCSGYPIAPEILFAKLNVSTGTAIKYPATHSLSSASCRQGHLVRLNQFEETAEDYRWVALIDFVISEEDLGEVLAFPKSPVRAR